MIRPAKLCATLATALYCSLFTAGVLGDDIDIFFGGSETGDRGQPNVLFILDDSGSMKWQLDTTKTAAGTKQDPSRLMVLKEAFTSIMQNANGINAGLMQLHGHGNGGSSTVYPITNIHKVLNQVAVTPQPPVLAQDGKEIRGSVTLDDTTLTLSNPSDLNDRPLIALRFTDIAIPKGATVDSAVLTLRATNDATSTTSIELKIENSSDSAALTTAASHLSLKNTGSAVVNWQSSSANWEADEDADSPNLAPLLQTAVNQTGWCGNNAITLLLKATSGTDLRSFYSQEGDQVPQLTFKYSGGEGGCINTRINASIDQGSDDVDQKTWTQKECFLFFCRVETKTNTSFTGHDLDLYNNGTNDNRRVGLRFTDLPIKQGTQILDARLELSLYEQSPATTVQVKIDNRHTAPEFSNSNFDLQNRYTSDPAVVDWALQKDTPSDTRVTSPDLKELIQQIVNKTDWQPNNAIAFVLENSSAQRVRFSSRDRGTGYAPRLILKIAHGSVDQPESYTVRDELISRVNSMTASNGTPVVPRLYDATQYYRNKLTTEGWATPMKNACQPNHIVLLTDGEANSNDAVSSIQKLNGIRACGGKGDNDIDGEQCGRSLSNWLGVTDLNSTLEEINNVTLHTIGFAMGESSKLDKDDQRARRKARAFMRDLAQENQGCTDAEMTAWIANPNDDSLTNCGYYQSDNAAQLVSAFAKIFESLNSIDSTFVSPGATVNQFNRSQHKNELYFALFQPKATQAWPGNLKRYALEGESSNSVKVVDALSKPAVDSNTGFFQEGAQSFWSDKPDGNSTIAGGAANKLPTPSNRKIFTLVNGQMTSIDNVTNAMLGLGSTTADDQTRQELINWARGLDADGKVRNAVGDPLHSRPAVTSYSCTRWVSDLKRACHSYTTSNGTRTEYADSALLFGTNEGFLHALDTRSQSGQEYFAFIPPELLKNLAIWKNNPSITSNRAYGLDGSPTLWVNDVNQNGVIYGGRTTAIDDKLEKESKYAPPTEGAVNFNEHVFAYIGMRRGGRNYHALDITNPENPSYQWGIEGGTGLFTRLGQTWARPIKTRVKIGTEVKDVLLFSGGYDEKQDQDDTADHNAYKGGYKHNDTMGNAIYMVDASTGELLWSASSPNDPGRNIAIDPNDASAGKVADHDLILNKMTYSIPGNIRAIDLYGDGLADQLFFADVGGQVWRLYINNGQKVENLVWASDSNNDGKSGADDGVFAYLGYPDTVSPTDWSAIRKGSRRFYHEPDVAMFRKNGTRYFAISIGSGFHADPMGRRNSETENHFYMLSTPQPYNPIVQGSDKVIPKHTTMSHSTGNLVDMTLGQVTDPIGDDPTKTRGWYIKLEKDELTSAPAISQDMVIYFNSFQKSETTNSCDASNGIGRAYRISIEDGSAIADNTDNTDPRCKLQRCNVLKSGGMPPETIILKPSDDYEVVCVGAECESRERSAQYGRTYWKEVR